ncbi:MAG: AAA family ATPase [Nitrospirae bacterium]|nr:AAA family ATPase [Nitrospirota bacterium]
MSGLAPSEFKLEAGGINVLLGEGQTAQVLRNLCFFIYEKTSSTNKDWANVAEHIRKLFGITLLPPKYITERGEITMSYKEHNITLDISSSGRGLQQTLLLLAHLYANPKTVLLLDEPDAHLEYLRKQEIYRLLTELSEKQGSQVISASHSTAVLNEAADRDIVIAFVGKPHRIDDRGTQTTKALKSIGFEHYYLAEETGWVLYLEGSTDLAMLKAFADTLEHDAASLLERPFVHWVENKPENVFSHFFGVSDAKKDLVGIAIFDRMDKVFEPKPNLTMLSWSRRELENYLCMEEVLLAYARYDLPDDLFGRPEAAKREQAMRDAISEVGTSLKTLRNLEPWSPDTKASDDFLDPLFRIYFAKLKLTNILRKTDYHVLAHLVPKDKIDVEIIEKLDAIVAVAKMAHPVGE